MAEWIIGDGEDNFDVKCPVCGWTDIFDVCGVEMVKHIAQDMHYCMSCGTKMSVYPNKIENLSKTTFVKSSEMD